MSGFVIGPQDLFKSNGEGWFFAMSCVPDRRVREFLELLLFSRNTGPAHTRARAHIHAHTCIYTHICTHIHIHAHIYAHTHTCTHTCTHAYIRAHMHTCAHTGAYTRTHACAQIDNRPQGSLIF